MSNITAIGVTKRKTGPLKVKFTENLSARLKRCTPVSDFDIINFVELPKPSTKLEALEFLLNHESFQNENIKQLVQCKYIRYRDKHSKLVRKSNLMQTTVEDILQATKR